MEDFRKPNSYQVTDDEKTIMMMFYTPNAVYRGEAVMKSSIRASLWMRTPAAPEYVHLLHAQVINFMGQVKPFHFPELFLSTSGVIAYHIAPPSQPDGFDYDETEKNRVFEAATAVVGNFLFSGNLRITSSSSANVSILSNRSTWTSLYHVEIASPALPQMGVIKVPMVLLRANMVSFGLVPSESQN